MAVDGTNECTCSIRVTYCRGRECVTGEGRDVRID